MTLLLRSHVFPHLHEQAVSSHAPHVRRRVRLRVCGRPVSHPVPMVDGPVEELVRVALPVGGEATQGGHIRICYHCENRYLRSDRLPMTT